MSKIDLDDDFAGYVENMSDEELIKYMGATEILAALRAEIRRGPAKNVNVLHFVVGDVDFARCKNDYGNDNHYQCRECEEWFDDMYDLDDADLCEDCREEEEEEEEESSNLEPDI